MAAPAWVTTFTVNSTSDSNFCGGICTLRGAINDANSNPGADTINFNIPGFGLQTIAPGGALPDITGPVDINGYSQPGSSANTSAVGDNAVLNIQLRGNTGPCIFCNGLTITGSNVTVRGLVIRNFNRNGVLITGSNNEVQGNFIGTNSSGTTDQGNSLNGVRIDNVSNNTVGGTTAAARNVISGNNNNGVSIDVSTLSTTTVNTVQGNYIGTQANGTTALANSQSGVSISGSNGEASNTIGGTASGAGNVISGNTLNGVAISRGTSASTTANTVQGNFVGTDAAGTSALGNTLDGVLITNANNNAVGGTGSGAGNVVAFNSSDGVGVASGTGNSILSNSIYSNGGATASNLGIDLGPDGRTLNDNQDPDPGANLLQNFPVLTSATRVGAGTTVSGTLNSNPNNTFTIQFFSSPTADPSGVDEGKTYLGQQTGVTTNASGNANFTVPVSTVAAGEFVTATATNATTNNTSEFSLSVQATEANLSITKIDSPDPVTFGNNLTYTINVNNSNAAGTATASNVQVTDPIPANTTLVSATSSQGSCPPPPNPGDSSGTVTCNLGTINAGGSATVTIVVRPTAAAVSAGSVSNTATVSSPNDPTNSSSTTTTAVNAANLSITKSDSADPVLVNGNFSYTLSVSNAAGAGQATSVTVSDTLPSGVTLNGPLPAGCSGTSTITCNLGTIAAGTSKSVTINVTAPGTPGQISNTATVSSPSDPSDSSDTETTDIVAAANLSINKTAPATVNQGSTFDYTVTIDNTGPSDATGVVVTDMLPSGLSFVNPGSDPSCSASGQSVSCNLGAVAVTDPAEQITIKVRADTAGNKSNTASVDSNESSPEDSNQTTTTVNPLADLAMAKDSNFSTVTAESIFTYRLTVTNNGPGDARNVTVKDALPAGVQFVTASQGCRNANNTVTCTSTDLPSAAGQNTKTFQIRVKAKTPGSKKNTSTVTSVTPDPNKANNTASVITRVVAPPPKCTIMGTDGPDVLRGTKGPDVLCGLRGNDTIYGLAGNDVIYGGDGDDVMYGGPGSDRINGGPGKDRGYGESGRDFLNMIDRVRGNDLADGGPDERDDCSADPGDRRVSCP
jgi:uncharacterized repeat protein (TIGR01451 family)